MIIRHSKRGFTPSLENADAAGSSQLSSHREPRRFPPAQSRVSVRRKPSAFFSAGFTLFFAILVSSTLLSIALMMLNFALKEQELSMVGRESQFAFFAADVGIECALYWDQSGVFATSTASGSAPASVNCGGANVAVTAATFNTTRATYTFTVSPSAGSSRCAYVTVDKNDSNRDGFSFTTIESRGVNRCSGSPKHRVERAVRAVY